MKRYWLTIMTALLLALFIPLTGSIAEGVVDESAEPALDTQIFLLPKITQDYTEKDRREHFVSALKDVVGSLVVDDSRQVVLFPAKNNKAPEIGQTVEFGIPYAVWNPTRWLQQVYDTDHLKAKKNIIIAIEGRSLQKEAEISEDWALLKQLAELEDVEVYMINLYTSKNEAAGRALATWISDGQLTEGSAYENILVDVSDKLHFTRITDYTHALQPLRPLLEELTGLQYTCMQADETGVYRLFSYVDLTLQQNLLVESSEQVQVTVTDQNGNVLNCESTVASKNLQAVTLPDNYTTLNVTVTGEHSALYWGYQYKALDGLKLVVQNREGKNSFARNEQTSFYASIPGMEQSKLVESMNSRGVACELINGETMEVLATMNYDAERNLFLADYTFTQPAEQLVVCARICLDEDVEFLSEPYIVHITNTAPVLTIQNESLYWVADPWRQVASLEIPLMITDAENDEIKLELVDLETGAIAGLGTVSVNDAEQCLEIGLFAEPTLGEEFSIKMRCSDGVAYSETSEINFTLYSLTEALQQMQNGATLILDGDNEVKKYQEISLHVALSFPENTPELWREALTQVIYERMEGKLSIVPSAPDAETMEIAMTKLDAGWQAVCSIPRADSYQLTAALVSDLGGWTIATQPVEIHVKGSQPVIVDETYPTWQKMVIPKSKTKQTAGFWLHDVAPSHLFHDEDGDEIIMTATAQRMVRGVPQGEAMMAQAIDDQPLEMCITQPGKYELSLVAEDADGASEKIVSTLYVLTYRQQIVMYVLLAAATLLLSFLLIKLLVYLMKPSFNGKIVEVTINSAHWSRTARISTNSWKKKAQPLNVLLLCVACPPDSVLYDAAAGCMIKPLRKGIMLYKGENLNLEKKCRISLNENATASVGQYTLTVAVWPVKTVPKDIPD